MEPEGWRHFTKVHHCPWLCASSIHLSLYQFICLIFLFMLLCDLLFWIPGDRF